jgi:hypothetical protein
MKKKRFIIIIIILLIITFSLFFYFKRITNVKSNLKNTDSSITKYILCTTDEQNNPIGKIKYQSIISYNSLSKKVILERKGIVINYNTTDLYNGSLYNLKETINNQENDYKKAAIVANNSIFSYNEIETDDSDLNTLITSYKNQGYQCDNIDNDIPMNDINNVSEEEIFGNIKEQKIDSSEVKCGVISKKEYEDSTDLSFKYYVYNISNNNYLISKVNIKSIKDNEIISDKDLTVNTYIESGHQVNKSINPDEAIGSYVKDEFKINCEVYGYITNN